MITSSSRVSCSTPHLLAPARHQAADPREPQQDKQKLIRVLEATVKAPDTVPSARLFNDLNRSKRSGVSGQPPPIFTPERASRLGTHTAFQYSYCTTRATRHRATIGGALSHADPAGDLPAVSLALDATVIVLGRGGEREIAAADFFVDYLTPALRSDEIVIGIRVPKLGSGWGYRYEKFQATAQAWAIVGVAALARRSNGHVCRGQDRADQHGPGAPGAGHGGQAGRRPARPPTGTRCARRPRTPRTAPARRPTCTPGPITGSTWPACSPAGRRRPPPEYDPARPPGR